MSRDWALSFQDMIACCDKITRYVGTSGRDEFLADEMAYDAVIRNLEVPGEAAKNLPADVKARMPGVDWRGIAGMRDWLSHGYFKVSDAIVWNAIEVEVPLLSRTLLEFRDRP